MKKILLFVLAATVSLPGQAQPDYPPSQIRFVVPFSPGGGTDVIMRLVAHHLGEAWKITALVENRVGAAGVIGSQHVATQPDAPIAGAQHLLLRQLHRGVVASFLKESLGRFLE